jgi:DNA-binding CsgD family transcriptional regulator
VLGVLMPTYFNSPRVTTTDWKILNLLISGAENSEIASELQMRTRTVKAHFSKLFSLFGIVGGVKRVKLAVLIYRSQSCQNFMEAGLPAPENKILSDSSPMDLTTK